MSFRVSTNIHIPWSKVNHNHTSTSFRHHHPPSIFTSDHTNSHFSSIYIQDVEQYCKDNKFIYNITKLSTPGDTLFIPAGWYHQVTSKGKVIQYMLWLSIHTCLYITTTLLSHIYIYIYALIYYTMHLHTLLGSKHMAINYWWKPYQWKVNSVNYEVSELPKLRTQLLDILL